MTALTGRVKGLIYLLFWPHPSPSILAVALP